jgi:hypothetical protein
VFYLKRKYNFVAEKKTNGDLIKAFNYFFFQNPIILSFPFVLFLFAFSHSIMINNTTVTTHNTIIDSTPRTAFSLQNKAQSHASIFSIAKRVPTKENLDRRC